MVRTISTSEARAGLGDVLGSVYYTNQPVIIERKGKAVAVVISPADFERFRRLDAAAQDDAGHPDARLPDDQRHEYSVDAFLADLQVIRRDHAAELAETPVVTLREIAERLGGLTMPGDGFADDIEAAHKAMNRPIELPEWPS